MKRLYDEEDAQECRRILGDLSTRKIGPPNKRCIVYRKRQRHQESILNPFLDKYRGRDEPPRLTLKQLAFISVHKHLIRGMEVSHLCLRFCFNGKHAVLEHGNINKSREKCKNKLLKLYSKWRVKR